MKLNIIRIFWAIFGGLAINGMINQSPVMYFGLTAFVAISVFKYYLTQDLFALKKHFLEIVLVGCLTSVPFTKNFELSVQLLCISWLAVMFWIFLIFFTEKPKLKE